MTTPFDAAQFREAVSSLLGFDFSPEEFFTPEAVRLPDSIRLATDSTRRVYCLMAAHFFAPLKASGPAALSWRIMHAYEAGVIGAPSKIRFGAVELTGNAITDAESETSSMVRAMASAKIRERETAEILKDVVAQGAITVPMSTNVLENSEMKTQLDELTKVTADLLAVVAEQQHEIEELRRRLDAATLARVQTEITKLAQDHHHALFAQARETIGSLGLANGEVTVGEIEHKGSLVVRLMRNGEETRARSVANRGADGLRVDVAAEVRGLAARIASVGVDVGVEVSKVRERTEATEQLRFDAESQQYEGTFETRQKGSTIRWNR